MTEEQKKKLKEIREEMLGKNQTKSPFLDENGKPTDWFSIFAGLIK
jgi:hypothetical protein